MEKETPLTPTQKLEKIQLDGSQRIPLLLLPAKSEMSDYADHEYQY